MKYWYIIAILCFFFPRQAMSQQELTLHFMQDVAQAGITNPAFFPEKKWVISVPSFAFNYGNNAFAYNDLIRKTAGDSTILDIDRVIDKLENENILQNQTNIELLRVHFRIVDNLYASVALNEFFSIKFLYSQDLIDLVWNGNAGSIGKTVALNPNLHAAYYRGLTMGLGHVWKNFRIGVQGKFLAGLADITTTRENSTIFTDSQTYAISINTDYQINTSGIDNFREDPLSAALNLRNKGIALDAGFALRLHKWKVAASISNFGFIRWQDNVTNYSNQEVLLYDGIGLNSYFDNGDFNFDNFLDSLKTTFKPKETYIKYRSNLMPKTYFSINYNPTSFLNLGTLLYTDWLEKPQHAFATYAGFTINKLFEVGFSYSAKNKTYNNFGLALKAESDKIQAFLVSDNFVNTFFPKSAKNVNFRWGINFLISDSKMFDFR